MKVGTDAVLLGAWTKCNYQPQTILDIGTGTGIIALMMAQKFPNACITAIDIDKNACIQAIENIKRSPWPNNIQIIETSLQDFYPSNKFELIISNPPYFINSYKSSEQARTTARHNDLLPFEALIDGVCRLLTNHGSFYIILPQKEGELFIEIAKNWDLHLNELTRVKTKKDSPQAKRLLMKFNLKANPLISNELIIETENRHQYSEEYKNLTRDFYLNF
jgi:tRNA1Val (adenine37-N6)-methyltransferase